MRLSFKNLKEIKNSIDKKQTFRLKKQIYKKVWKFQVYKKYNSDLWGILYNTGKRCRVVRKLFYLFHSFPVKFPRVKFFSTPKRKLITLKNRSFFKKRNQRPDFFQVLCNLKFSFFGGRKSRPGYGSRYKKRKFALRRLKIFYGNYSWHHLLKYLKKKTRGNSSGRNELALLNLFESKLCTILFRSTFFLNIAECCTMIRLGNVLVNYKPIFCPNFLLQNFDFISFSLYLQKKLKKFIFFRLCFFRYLFGPPAYIEVNFKLCHIVFLKNFFLPHLIRSTFKTKFSLLQGCFNRFK